MTALLKVCKNCEHYELGSNIAGGERSPGCRKSPPTTFLVPGQDERGQATAQFMAVFPPVAPNGWCGELAMKGPVAFPSHERDGLDIGS